MKELFLSLKSDMIKNRHTFTPWLFWIGVLFLPVVFLFIDLFNKSSGVASSPIFWNDAWARNWSYMGSFINLGIILGTGQIFQAENKNNGWKQVFTYPRTLSEIFYSKYMTVVIIMFVGVVFFIIAFSIEAILTTGMFTRKFPVYLPSFDNWIERLFVYLCCFIATISFQFLLNVIFKNLVISTSVGIVSWMITSLSSFFYVNPFALFIRYSTTYGTSSAQTGTVLLLALLQTIVYTGLAFIIFHAKKQKT